MSSAKEYPSAVASREEVESEFPVNPVGELDVQRATALETNMSPLLPLPEEEFAAVSADVSARRNKVEMKQVLSVANRAGDERAKWEAEIVHTAQKRASYQNRNDPTASYTQPVIATPLYADEQPTEDTYKVNTQQQPQEESSYSSSGYQVSSYDTSSYEIKDYKSIYDS